MKKQTAVEWLDVQIQDKIFIEYGYGTGIKKIVIPVDYYMEFIKQAKQMEKEQIVEAFDEGQEYEYQYHVNGTPKFDSETYFIETYKGGEQ